MENRIEIWKPVVGYEGLYECSSLGNVRSSNYNHTNKPKLLKQELCKNGGLRVTLYKHTKTRFLVHRLVAQAFIPNPDNLPEIDHISTDRTDNKIENLRWATRKSNMNNPLTRNNLSTSKLAKTYNIKPVLQYTPNGKYLKEYICLREAERLTGINHSSIMRVCKGKQYSAGGFIWKYKEVA